MKIAMVYSTGYPPSDGISTYCEHLSSHLIQRGHDVTLLTRARVPFDRTVTGRRVIGLPFRAVYPLHVALHGRHVKRALSSIKPDVVHVHSPLSPSPPAGAYPLVATIHTPMREDARHIEGRGLRQILGTMQARTMSYYHEMTLLSRADVITAVSASVSHQLREYGVAPGTCQVVGNGVDLQEVHPPVKEDQREAFALHVGRLDLRKGLFDLLKAWERLAERGERPALLIAGSGPLKDALRLRAEKAGLTHVEFLGFVPRPDLLALYRRARMVVCASLYEGLPTTLLEAMASGTPIVATAASGTTDLVEHRKTGWLVPLSDPNAFADAVAGLWQDEAERESLGAAGRRLVTAAYGWPVITDRFEAAYQRARG